jgi:hypothetical protein
VHHGRQLFALHGKINNELMTETEQDDGTKLMTMANRGLLPSTATATTEIKNSHPKCEQIKLRKETS